MREVLLMWRDSRMIILTVVVTAIYTAVLIPFKGFVLIPGFTEVRLANVFPVVFSLVFGPAAAWGSAFGNLIGDVFGGTLTAGSAFGFVGNFFFGFAGYKLWGNLGRLSSGRAPTMESAGQVVEFLVVVLVSGAGTAAIIAWGLDVLGLVPFPVIGPIIFVNNVVATAVLGPLLLRFVYPRVERDGLLYPDLMREGDLPSVSERRQRIGAAGIAIASLAWIVVGTGIGVGVQGVPLGATPGEVTSADVSESQIQLLVGAAAGLLLLAASLLSGEWLSGHLRGEDRSRSEDEPAR